MGPPPPGWNPAGPSCVIRKMGCPGDGRAGRHLKYKARQGPSKSFGEHWVIHPDLRCTWRLSVRLGEAGAGARRPRLLHLPAGLSFFAVWRNSPSQGKCQEQKGTEQEPHLSLGLPKEGRLERLEPGGKAAFTSPLLLALLPQASGAHVPGLAIVRM